MTQHERERSPFHTYGASRLMKSMTDPEIVCAFPYAQWLTVGNGTAGFREVRVQHAILHGKTFRHDDAIWSALRPPTDEWCRCTVILLTRGQVKRRKLGVCTFLGFRDDGMPDLQIV